MDIKTLESFRLADAIKFHDELNPKLWDNGKLRPEVKKQLKLIADDFLEELGISDLDVSDITVSGSNAAYSYTPHSDLDLHILVDMSKLENGEIYKELFTAKKNAYNDSHHIKIHGVPIELYIQDTNQPVISLGEYSLVNDKWLKLPTKRRANLDQNATKAKYEKLLDIINRSMVKPNSDKINDVIKTIKRYRQAGLDKGGEFGPENLAYKALRTQGYIDKLYDLRDKLHSRDLSIESIYDEDYDPNGPPPGPEFKPTMPQGTVRVDVSDVYDWYKLGQNISNLAKANKSQFGKGPPSTIMAFGSEPEEHKYINQLMNLGLTTTDIDPIDPNQPKGMKRQKVDPTFNVLDEAKMSIRSQIINDVQKNGPGEYFVRFTDSDKLGFSQKQMFGKTPDIGDTIFDVDNIGQNTGRRVLWFYPLSYYLKNYKDVYASEQPYVWLVKLKPNAWLQKVKRGDTKKLEAPSGKQRVGILRMSDPPAALFFSHGYDVIGKYQDYSKQHISHGQVKGRPEPSFFDKVRVIDENSDEPKQGAKSAIYSTDVYGMTAYHSKCLEPGCDWESKRYDSIKLAQNAAQKHAQKHFKQGVAEGRKNLKEVNAPGELSVPEELVQQFTNRGWSIAGEGRDQIVLSKPGNRYVLKIVGQGSGQRIDMIRRYINFYRQHQRNPHFPKVGGDRTFRWQDKTYYAYTQEQLKHLPGDEAVLDYLEYAMSLHAQGLEPKFDLIPPGLKVEQVKGLIYAVDELIGAGIGDTHSFDLTNVYNIMQRDNGQLVIVDPFADFNDEEVNINLEEGASGYIPSNAEKNDLRFKSITEKINYIVKQDIDWTSKIELLESLSTNSICESLDKQTKKQILALVKSFNSKNIKIGKNYIPVLIILRDNAPMFFDINQNYPAKAQAQFGKLIDISNEQYKFEINGKVLTYPNDLQRELTLTSTILIDSVENYEKLRNYTSLTFEAFLPPLKSVNESASGYIPSEKEKNDPRYKSALTVDIKPDTMKKDAKKFGNKISRAGIPPTLRANGKF